MEEPGEHQPQPGNPGEPGGLIWAFGSVSIQPELLHSLAPSFSSHLSTFVFYFFTFFHGLFADIHFAHPLNNQTNAWKERVSE